MMNTTPPEHIETDDNSDAVTSTASSVPFPESASQCKPADIVPSPKRQHQQRHWVLLRGLSRDARHWEAFPEQLQQAFPDDRVTCLNLPGTGPNHQLKSPANISQMVDWLREHYAASLKQQPLHLLTISMGGMLAADWMHRFPEEVAACVMINTSSKLSPVNERMRPGTLWAFCKALMSSITKREQVIVERTSNRHTDNADLTNRWRIYQQQQPVSAMTIVKQLFAASQFEPQAVSQPLLLLASRQDRVVNPKCSEVLAAFWSADLRMHKSAGHDIPLDDSEWLLTQLHLWLEKNEDNLALSETKNTPETAEDSV